MGSHQLLAVTAEQKEVEKRIRNLDRWVARERDAQIARILRHEIDLLHLEWNHLQDQVDVETFESEPQATSGPGLTKRAFGVPRRTATSPICLRREGSAVPSPVEHSGKCGARDLILPIEEG